LPLVSVVIPTHNRPDRVGSAIRSVLDQTFSDLELVVVDDGSRQSAEPAVRAAADPRVRFIRHEAARGDAAARNTGIRSSSGELVAFLDDDDEWLPEKLSVQVAEFRRAPEIALLHTGRFVVSAAGETRSHSASGDGDTQVRRSQITTSTVAVRRESLEAAGLFDETIPFCSDWDLWIRITRRFRIGYVDIPLIRYFASTAGLSGNLAGVIEGQWKVLAKHAAFFEADPESYSDFLVGLGFICCYAGQMNRGREAFRKAIELRPAAWKAYVHYAVSFTSRNGFRMIEALPRRFGLNWGAAPAAAGD